MGAFAIGRNIETMGASDDFLMERTMPAGPPSDTPRGLFPTALMSTGTETGRGSEVLCFFWQPKTGLDIMMHY